MNERAGSAITDMPPDIDENSDAERMVMGLDDAAEKGEPAKNADSQQAPQPRPTLVDIFEPAAAIVLLRRKGKIKAETENSLNEHFNWQSTKYIIEWSSVEPNLFDVVAELADALITSDRPSSYVGVVVLSVGALGYSQSRLLDLSVSFRRKSARGEQTRATTAVIAASIMRQIQAHKADVAHAAHRAAVFSNTGVFHTNLDRRIDAIAASLANLESMVGATMFGAASKEPGS